MPGVCPSTAQVNPPLAGGRAPGDARSAAAGAALPCQRDNKCIGTKASNASYRRKRKLTVRLAVEYLVKKHGIERLGFLTLTFADHVTDPKEAWRRFKSLRTNAINQRYPDGWLCVLERQKSGRLHFHLLVVCPADIRTGANFGQFRCRVYTSANPALRSEWAFWRNNAKRWRFGRTEILPIKKDGDRLASYVGKYLDKHQAVRLDIDKGVHLVSSSQGVLPSTKNISSNSPSARLWRRKLAVVAKWYGITGLDGFKREFGSKWAYKLGNAVRGVDLAKAAVNGEVHYDSVFQAELDGRHCPDELRGHVGSVSITVKSCMPSSLWGDRTSRLSLEHIPPRELSPAEIQSKEELRVTLADAEARAAASTAALARGEPFEHPLLVRRKPRFCEWSQSSDDLGEDSTESSTDRADLPDCILQHWPAGQGSACAAVEH